MDFALGTFLLLILLAPGAIFRISYLKSDSLKYTIDTSLIGEFLYIIIISFLFHILGFFILIVPFSLIAWANDLINGILFFLVEGVEISEESQLLITEVIGVLIIFLIYSLIIIYLASVFGKNLREYVIRRNLDFKYPFLKVSNHWYYLFSGREVKYNTRMDFDLIQIDALVPTNEGDILYSGILHSYFLDRYKLDKIYLKYVFRRWMEKTEETNEYDYKETSLENEESLQLRNLRQFEDQFDERFSKVAGNFLVLTYSAIKNINVSYVIIEEKS